MPVKLVELAAPRLGVEALDVARLGHRQRRVDEDLDEFALGQQLARHPRSERKGEMKATSTIRPASTISLADLGDAADILHPVGIGEAQIAG